MMFYNTHLCVLHKYDWHIIDIRTYDSSNYKIYASSNSVIKVSLIEYDAAFKEYLLYHRQACDYLIGQNHVTWHERPIFTCHALGNIRPVNKYTYSPLPGIFKKTFSFIVSIMAAGKVQFKTVPVNTCESFTKLCDIPLTHLWKMHMYSPQ